MVPVEAAARGVLPLGFRREPGAAPLAECLRVAPRDVDHRMAGAAGEVGVGALRVPPVGAMDLAPPRSVLDPGSGWEVVR